MPELTEIITFFKAVKADLPFIVEIYNQNIESRIVTADLTPITVDSRITWFYAHQTPDRPLWVIHYKNKPCGWISLSTFYDRPAYRHTAEISIYIHRNFHGKKIGQFAIKTIEEYAIQNDIKTILAFIFGHNIPSLSLFNKMGYQKWGHFANIAELDSVERDLVILGKRIAVPLS